MEYIKTYSRSVISDSDKDFRLFLQDTMGGEKYALIKSVEVLEQSDNVIDYNIGIMNWSKPTNLPNSIAILGNANAANAIVELTVAVTFDAMIDTIDIDLYLLRQISGTTSYAATPLIWNDGAILGYNVLKVEPELDESFYAFESYFTGDRLNGYIFNANAQNTEKGLHKVRLELIYGESRHIPNNEFKVEYRTMGGSGIVPSTITKLPGEIFTILNEEPYYKGYEFMGWQDISKRYSSAETYMMPNRNVVFLAVWKYGDAPPPSIEYKGTVTGTGEKISRINEITADNLAVERDFMIGYNGKFDNVAGAVLEDDGHDFSMILSDSKFNITITDGIACAYGYCAYYDSVMFSILPPAVLQYHLIYLEIDRSRIPNACAIKIKNNQSSPYYEMAFRQDVLSSVKTGIFQLPLWRIKMSSDGIIEQKDLRKILLHGSIENTQHTDTAYVVRKSLENGVTCANQPLTDNSQKIANTAFVQTAISEEFNK